MARILVVDDEIEICDLIKVYLQHEGYEVLTAYNGIKALEYVKNESIDLVVLDVMLPDLDGLSVCKKIRERSDMAVLMLSAKREDKDRISGIITGADDYMVKPFNPLELVVKIKAILKRTLPKEKVEEGEFYIQDLKITIDAHKVTKDGEEIILTAKEFDILLLMALNRDIVFSSKMIYEQVWKESFYKADGVIMTHIKNLREKLGDNVKHPKYIKTVWGVGYKIEK